MASYSEFAPLVNDLRKRRKLTAAQLADLSGVKLRTLQSYLQGDRAMPAPTAAELLRALGMNEPAIQRAGRIAMGEPYELEFGGVEPSEQPKPEGALPQELRINAKRFELEAIERGADEFASRFIHSALNSEEAVVMFHGGYRQPASLETMQKRQNGLIQGLRLWLDSYLEQQDEAKRR